MQLKDIFIFRHGETDWNRERRYQGHTDVPLNEEGRRQAESLRLKLERLKPEAIVSSDLTRALTTAHIANQTLQLPIHAYSHFRECHLGEAEGLHRDVMIEKFGADHMEKWASVHPQDLDFRFPNGESKFEMLSRMKKGVSEFFREFSHHRSIALSTHGGSLRALVHSCEGAPTQPIALHNCVLYHIQFDALTDQWFFVQGPVEI